MPGTDKNKTFKTRIGTIISAYQTKSFSGQRDIGGSVVTNSGRIVLAVGGSDLWQEVHFKIAVSDDGGEDFAEKFVMPAVYDVTYHTVGMLYDEKNDILMALFGETKGYQLFNKRNDYSSGMHKAFSPKNFGHSKLLMARSIDNGETWKLFTLYDYKENNREHIACGGIVGCGVQVDGDVFVPQYLASANEARNAFREEILLSRIRNLARKNSKGSFEFENDFRVLSSNSDQDIRYSDEIVYIRKIDHSGFLSFNRTSEGMPFRREYDNRHNPSSDFQRVYSSGFDHRDYAAGVHGPGSYAFNVIRMLDGNLLMASRFRGTEHHKGGNIFLTSRDEGLTWDYEDDQIPCSLKPFHFYFGGGGGNPSMSYMPDASLIHTTSAGQGTIPHALLMKLANGGTFVHRFRGFVIDTGTHSRGARGTLSVDTSEATSLDPVYIANCLVTDKNSIEFDNCNSGDPLALLVLPPEYSPDRRKIRINYRVTGRAPFIKLKITLANKANSHRPTFEPVINI